MSNEIPVINEAELINILRNSLYPGSQDESIKLVIGYCKATGLDIMQKPVHIVPMYDSKSRQMRDTIMPGIGLYRTQAARTGQYAGISEPEFGRDITETLGGVVVTYPAWCKITVKRMLDNGLVAEFAATELWKENYATRGGAEKSIAPNAMWLKRPYGQLAKCTEAQALRKAFPEIGSAPTAEEMEGKQIAYSENSEAIPYAKADAVIENLTKKQNERQVTYADVDLAEALLTIQMANNKETLGTAKEKMLSLPDEERKLADSAYREKVSELKKNLADKGEI